MNKMDGKSMDLTAENIAQLKALFPEAVTEGKIDFDVLKALLGGEIEQRQEYYKFTWNGKEATRAYARTCSMGTLRPSESDSLGKDGAPGGFDSENLYIEGDNLEVLKLLQGAYHKKVKMIYIDPPYNTGKDFVYPDNFRDSIGNYKALTGQTDEEGKSTRSNPETSGRYHTDWLNMMYPRLVLARNLLTDDGVIFISIDDTEVANLRKLSDDVFGEENFVSDLVWQKKHTRANDAKYFSDNHDFVVVYCKNKELWKLNLLPRTENGESLYSNPDNDPRGPWASGPIQRKDVQSSGLYTIVAPNGKKHLPPPGTSWRFSETHMNELIADNHIYFGTDGNNIPRYKRFLSEVQNGLVPTTIWSRDDCGDNQEAISEIKHFFDSKLFETPKPTRLIRKMLMIAAEKDCIILDFFSGSATTAHAVLQLNAEDGGNRKFIMVQLPEVCEEGTEAAKAGYKNICEIGKERIRRAAKKIKEENPLFAGDVGFKVFKLDTSNLIPWNPDPENIDLTLRNAVENTLMDRSRQDLLYEVLLKCNLPLTLPIEEKKAGENTVYIVGMGALAICLDTRIPVGVAEAIVRFSKEYAPIVPMRVVFRDNGFNDVTKTNAMQILKQNGFEEKSIQTI